MRVLENLLQLADIFEELAVAMVPAVSVGKDAAAKVIKAKVDEIYGNATKLATLSDYTQVDRASQGFSQNEPLLRDGELLKDSVRIEDIGPEGADIGSDEPVHLYHELGYMNMRTGNPVPARPVFHIAAAESEELVATIMGEELEAMFVKIIGD